MALIKRLVKGSPLTFQEGDNNLQYLEDLSNTVATNFSNWTGSSTSQLAGTASYSNNSNQAATASYITPAGLNTQIQYNKSGSLAADSSFTWNSGSRSLTLTGNGVSNLTSPVFRIIDGATSTKRLIQFDEPISYNTEGRQSFPFVYQWHPSSNGDGTTNNVAKWGFNIDGVTAGQSGLFYTLEPDWVSGGLPYREAHLTYTYPSGSQIRLFSSTVQQRGTLRLTTNQWDFRATTFAVKDLEDNDYFVIQKANGSGTAAGAWLGGYQPTWEVYDYNASKRWILQNNGSGGSIIQGGLAINSYFGTDANLYLTNVGGVTGAAVMKMQYVDGTAVIFSANGSSVGGNYANTFYMYDSSTGRAFLKNYKSTGNLLLGDGSATDHGEYVQIIGTSYHSTTSSFAGPVDITGSLKVNDTVKISVSDASGSNANDYTHYPSKTILRLDTTGIDVSSVNTAYISLGRAGNVPGILFYDNYNDKLTSTGMGICGTSLQTFTAGTISGANYFTWNVGGYQSVLGTNELMRLINNGNLLLGTTTDSGYKLNVSGSINVSQLLQLTPQSPLPSGTTGSLAASGSLLYFHDGTNWRQVQLV